MANQSQPRPWLRLGSIARPVGPSPSPTPRPQRQPPPALLPRPTMLRPTFRPPIVTQPGQDVSPPLQPPRPRAPPPVLPAVTPSSAPPPLPSPVSPPKSLPRIATSPITQKSPLASPGIQNSRNASPVIQNPPRNTSPGIQNPSRNAAPVIQNSPRNAAPVIQNSPRNAAPVVQNSPRNAAPVTQESSPESPVTQKYPYVGRASSTISSQSLSPSFPKPRNQSSPPSIPSSPAMKQDVAKPMQASPAKLSSPSPPSKPLSPYSKQMVPSPRAAKPFPDTPPESPKINAFQHSPPLFSLPPSQLKSSGVYERNIPAISEQKIVRNPYDDNSMKPKARVIKKVSESEDIGMRAITISGENRGAVMELGYPPGTHGNTLKLRSDGELSEGNLSGNEGRSKMEGRNPNARAKASTPMHTFMNSNVQGINSSIVFNSTLSHHDPGVHLSMSRNPVKGLFRERSNGHNVLQKEE